MPWEIEHYDQFTSELKSRGVASLPQHCLSFGVCIVAHVHTLEPVEFEQFKLKSIPLHRRNLIPSLIVRAYQFLKPTPLSLTVNKISRRINLNSLNEKEKKTHRSISLILNTTLKYSCIINNSCYIPRTYIIKVWFLHRTNSTCKTKEKKRIIINSALLKPVLSTNKLI